MSKLVVSAQKARELLYELSRETPERPEILEAARELDNDLREHQTDHPSTSGGDMIDASGDDPHARNSVLFDARQAVLVDGWNASVAHTTHAGEPQEDAVALLVTGRINRPPDDQASAERPAEEVRHLHLMPWESAAYLICDLQALAGRAGFDLTQMLEDRWRQMIKEGLVTVKVKEEP